MRKASYAKTIQISIALLRSEASGGNPSPARLQTLAEVISFCWCRLTGQASDLEMEQITEKIISNGLEAELCGPWANVEVRELIIDILRAAALEKCGIQGAA